MRSWRAWGERHGLDGEAIQAGNHGAPGAAVIAEHIAPSQLDEEAALLAHAETTTPTASSRSRARPTCSPCRARRDRHLVHGAARTALGSRAAGLPVPDVLVTADQVENGKPAPDPYLLAAERLGVDPAACLVFEDAPAGIAAGRAAGMTVWAVTTTRTPDALDGAGAARSPGPAEHLASLRLS